MPSDIEKVRKKYESLSPVMDERMRRLWAGAEAESLGDGGIVVVEKATGMSRTTIRAGRDELRAGVNVDDVVQVRRPGAGRPSLVERSPELLVALESLVNPVTRGDPESPLRWTTKSTRKLAEELKKQGHKISPQKVGQLLREMDYSLQSTRKVLEGKQHPDRNEQFEFINDRVETYHQRGLPVISVDSKKKENIGDFGNAGREWQSSGAPVPVRVHDFVDKTKGKVTPYGVYDLSQKNALVNVGVSGDTAEFAVESIWRWWRFMGRYTYPEATELLITADGGGSNGYRLRLWKTELQDLAERTGLTIGVSHFPPGTSKWNKIEHRLFCHVTANWRGRPLTDHETVVQLIGSVRTSSVHYVKAKLDTHTYATGIKVTDKELEECNIIRDEFHGDWNYTIVPREYDVW